MINFLLMLGSKNLAAKKKDISDVAILTVVFMNLKAIGKDIGAEAIKNRSILAPL